jgi:hypothetical protein
MRRVKEGEVGGWLVRERGGRRRGFEGGGCKIGEEIE